MFEGYIKIPAKELKVGDNFRRLHLPDGRIAFANYEVVEKIGTAAIKIKVFGKYEETYSTDNLFVERAMTKEELHTKYQKDKEELTKKLKNKMSPRDDIGHYEMYNGWIEVDPWEFAASCKKENIKIIGYFELEQPFDLGYVNLDIGIVAEDEDGDRFWCHSASDWFKGEEWENE